MFEYRHFPPEEMFYIIKEMAAKTTAQIARELDRDYDSVLDFVHKVQGLASKPVEDVTLESMCEIEEIYVTAGEKGRKQNNAKERGKGSGASESDEEKRSKEIEKVMNRVVVLNTDNYRTYKGMVNKNGILDHKVVNHSKVP